MDKTLLDAKLDILGCKEQFYANLRRDISEEETVAHCIDAGFFWGDSPEGRGYWYTMYCLAEKPPEKEEMEPLPDEYYEHLSSL